MKKFLLISMILLAVTGLISCRKIIGKGPLVTEIRTVSDFNSISFDLPGELVFTESNIRKVEIEAQQNIIDVIETYVVGTDLKIKLKHNTNIRSREDIKVYVSGPSVNALAVNGSGDIRITDQFRPNNLRLSVNGSGHIYVNDLVTKTLDLSIRGSGNIMIKTGEAEEEQIDVSGSGEIDLLGISALSADINTSGSATVKVQVSEDLYARISGSGTVYYLGSPSINTDISGSGKIVKL